MKVILRFAFSLFVLLTTGFFLTSFLYEKPKTKFSFPYKKAGLNDRQAAAHLLSRFTYGARPGDVDAAVKTGLEKWFLEQLTAKLKDDSLNLLLDQYPAMKLSNSEIVEIYPRGGQAVRMAIKDGFIHKDSVGANRKSYRTQLNAYMQMKGLKPQQDLYREFISQKILRASYSKNQLQEVLTDFWFNHFNVSLDKGQCAEFIPVYERDVIRPNVFKKFDDLLLATAKSPAMLRYLDNFSSVGSSSETLNKRLNFYMSGKADTNTKEFKELQKLKQSAKNKGLNENYAREVMELHTLGVDGGYTQEDVTQAARVLTGWGIYPMNDGYGGNALKKNLDRQGEAKLIQKGYVIDGDFLFTPDRHDKKEKVVLGKRFTAGGGYEEGVALLNMLASHPATARFISKKIAVRFVSDNPPQSLVDKMAKTFQEKNGDIRQVLITMATAPEFWSEDALREKTKSPFELAISAVRSLDADIRQPYQLYTWITKMGQKVYYYQAPTGFPDRGTYWINTGSLLNRMNFGLALASQRIPGVKINLPALNNSREPESAEAALVTYSKMIMPERNLTETIKRLTPMLSDPSLTKKIADAAAKTKAPSENNMSMMNEDAVIMNENERPVKKFKNSQGSNARQTAAANNTMLAQVVGVIIGSPEFQRK